MQRWKTAVVFLAFFTLIRVYDSKFGSTVPGRIIGMVAFAIVAIGVLSMISSGNVLATRRQARRAYKRANEAIRSLNQLPEFEQRVNKLIANLDAVEATNLHEQCRKALAATRKVRGIRLAQEIEQPLVESAIETWSSRRAFIAGCNDLDRLAFWADHHIRLVLKHCDDLEPEARRFRIRRLQEQLATVRTYETSAYTQPSAASERAASLLCIAAGLSTRDPATAEANIKEAEGSIVLLRQQLGELAADAIESWLKSVE